MVESPINPTESLRLLIVPKLPIARHRPMRITHNLVRLRSPSPLHGGEPENGGMDGTRTRDFRGCFPTAVAKTPV